MARDRKRIPAGSQPVEQKNKEVFSENLKYLIEQSGKDRKELAEIWGFPYSTVSEWVNAKKYPRIDRIEIMANYFGVSKSALIETQENWTGSFLICENAEPELYGTVKLLRRMEPKQLSGVKAMLESMLG